MDVFEAHPKANGQGRPKEKHEKGVVHMNNIVTWEHYNSMYNKASQDQFVRLEAQAEMQVLSVVGRYKWDRVNASAFYYAQLQDCICRVIDRLVDFEKGGAGKGVASVSNDGYSESYAVRTASEYDTETRTCIRHWLSGTGLTSAFPWGG